MFFSRHVYCKYTYISLLFRAWLFTTCLKLCVCIILHYIYIYHRWWFQILFYPGEMIQFDDRIFFRWVGSTTNQIYCWCWPNFAPPQSQQVSAGRTPPNQDFAKGIPPTGALNSGSGCPWCPILDVLFKGQMFLLRAFVVCKVVSIHYLSLWTGILLCVFYFVVEDYVIACYRQFYFFVDFVHVAQSAWDLFFFNIMWMIYHPGTVDF